MCYKCIGYDKRINTKRKIKLTWFFAGSIAILKQKNIIKIKCKNSVHYWSYVFKRNTRVYYLMDILEVSKCITNK